MIMNGTSHGVSLPVRGSMAKTFVSVCVLTVIILVVHQASVHAGSKARIEKAAALMEQGDYAPAYCIWMALAEDGNSEAQYILGWMYHNGYGVAIDDQHAYDWWAEAANEDHVEAQFALGMLLSEGIAGSKNIDEAVAWYSKAAENGHEEASLVLLAMANRGNGTAADTLKTLARKGQIGTDIRIRVDLANIREKPSTTSVRLATLKKGTKLIELGRSGKWHRVWVPGLSRVAWIHEELVE